MKISGCLKRGFDKGDLNDLETLQHISFVFFSNRERDIGEKIE